MLMAEMRKRVEVELRTWLAQRWLQCVKTLMVLQPSWQHPDNICTFGTNSYLHKAASVLCLQQEATTKIYILKYLLYTR